jgi:hypothetical protein
MSIDPIRENRFCSLSPEFQQKREIQAILKDPTYLNYLNEIGATESTVAPYAVHDNGDREYIVQTNTPYFIRVIVHYTHADRRFLGPSQFALEISPPALVPTFFKGLIPQK